MLFQNFEGKLVSHSTRMGFVLLPLGMCQKSLLRPPAALELSESFRSLIWRINLGGLLTWISLVAGIFDHPCYLERERCIHLRWVLGGLFFSKVQSH